MFMIPRLTNGGFFLQYLIKNIFFYLYNFLPLTQINTINLLLNPHHLNQKNTMKKLITLTLSLVVLGASTFAQHTDTLKKKTTTVKTEKKTVTEGVNKSTDKAIGKDAKGRTIYEGPKGGQYTLSENGKKTYLPAKDKIKVN